MALQNRLETLVAVFGGSGFLGRHVVRALAKRGYRVRVAVRRPELAGHLQPMGRVGQIHAVQANLRYPESVKAATRDADVVINLVGILFERGRQRFVRPSIIFGPEDDFFNRFAALARMSPALPLVGGGRTRMQPVFAGDVAEAIAKAVDGDLRPGATYELGGPEVRTFKELMQFVLAATQRRRVLIPVPFAMMKLQALVLLAVLEGRAVGHDQDFGAAFR